MRTDDTRTKITQALSQLIGLPLAQANNAGNMKTFQFGALRPHPQGRGTIGQFALHSQCPWRIVSVEGPISGFSDYGEPDAPDLQAWIDSHDGPIVKSVSAGDQGDLCIEFNGGFQLQIFPCSTIGEDWRFFAPGTEDPHLVIEAGRITND